MKISFNQKFFQFAKYCFCGGVGVTIDLSFYFFMIALGVWYQSANFISYFFGTLMSFYLNRRFTFVVYDNTFRRLLIFLTVASLGYLISALLLHLFIIYLNFDLKVSKVITLPIVLLTQFFLNKKVTFKESNKEISNV